MESFQQRILAEFADHRGAGPFLGDRAEPSLADVSLYPLVLFGDTFRLKGDTPWRDSADAQVWVEHMRKYFDESPLPSVTQTSRSD